MPAISEKRSTVGNNRFVSSVVGALAAAVLTAVVAVSAASAQTAKTIAFTAKYAGAAVVRVDGNVAAITANGPGKGTLLGVGKVTGKGVGDSSQQPCVPFTGTGTLIGTGTTKLFFKVIAGSSGCGDEDGKVFSISARAVVTKATGKLAKAKGKLKITGIYDRGKGTFSVKFAGTLTQ
jgi:hypothetical protein